MKRKEENLIKNSICPKCQGTEILKVKDIFHTNGAGNIITKNFVFKEKNTAFFTFYICTNCGLVEHYLDTEELKKLKQNLKETE